MKPEHQVVEALGQFLIQTHYYASPAPRGTVILVNGSLATMAAFAQTVRFLQPHFNVVLFDEPYSGESKHYNANQRPITKEQEAGILLELIAHFGADHMLSFSWGGASALLALAKRPPTMRKAVVMAFSPLINRAMRSYLETGINLLLNCERRKLGMLLNETIGEHLPSLVKRYNFRHIISLHEHEYQQMAFHVSQILTQDTRCYLTGRCCSLMVIWIVIPARRTRGISAAMCVTASMRRSPAPDTSWTWKTRTPGRKPVTRCSTS